MDRSIFDHEIWQDPLSFRLFFYLVGKAAFKDGVKTGNTTLKRGQFLRSYRKIQEDLTYIENRAIKEPSLSSIKRSVEKLIKLEVIKIEGTELGTLFTVLNYDQYQAFHGSQNEQLETALEQRWNSVGTTAEHRRNNKNEGRTRIDTGILFTPEKSGETKKSTSKKKAQASYVPDDFEITESMREWATRKFGTLPWLEDATEHFLEDAQAKGKKFSDWTSAWRTWIRNAVTWGTYSKHGGKPGNNSGSGLRVTPASERKGGSGQL